jgi:hypothetical protein
MLIFDANTQKTPQIDRAMMIGVILALVVLMLVLVRLLLGW